MEDADTALLEEAGTVEVAHPGTFPAIAETSVVLRVSVTTASLTWVAIQLLVVRSRCKLRRPSQTLVTRREVLLSRFEYSLASLCFLFKSLLA